MRLISERQRFKQDLLILMAPNSDISLDMVIVTLTIEAASAPRTLLNGILQHD
jgi:hypothetical protein